MKSAKTITSGQIYLWDDILRSGLDTDLFIKKSKYDSVDLSSNIECHEKTYFPGFTFLHYPNTNKFRIEENDFNSEKVERLTQIRNLEWEINCLEIKVWTCKMDGKITTLSSFENNLAFHKTELLNLLNNRILKLCA